MLDEVMHWYDSKETNSMVKNRTPTTPVMAELEQHLIDREVRLAERIAILRTLQGEDGEAVLSNQIAELRERLEDTARNVRKALS